MDCVDYIKGKMTKTKRNGSIRSENLLEIIHTDICEPFSSPALNNQYYIYFIDDYS